MVTGRSAQWVVGAQSLTSADPESVKRAFAPVVDECTRVLVLGSLPGDASLAASQYYAHPRNGFWRLISAVVGRDLVSLAYPDRLQALRAYGIGLWDVIATAERQGSLDAAIRNPEAADLRTLIGSLPNLRALAFNGATAAKLGRRQLTGVSSPVQMIDLPSSSPAHARPMAEKAARWAPLTALLAGD